MKLATIIFLAASISFSAAIHAKNNTETPDFSPLTNKFSDEARDLVFFYSYEVGQAKKWRDVIRALKNLYARDHSFDFYVNGEKEPIKFRSHGGASALDIWAEEVDEKTKNTYLRGRYIVSGYQFNAKKKLISYQVDQLVDGYPATHIKVYAKLTREDSELRYRHADIYFYEYNTRQIQIP